MTQVDEFFSEADQLPPSRNASSWARRITGIAVLLAVAALAWGTWSFISSFTGGPTAQVDYVGDGTGQVEIIVARGDTLTAIGQTLADAAARGPPSGIGVSLRAERESIVSNETSAALPWTTA